MATDKKTKNPRNVRTYKVVDSVYKKALSRAKKEKVPLSNSIENWITEYAGMTGTNVIYQNINADTSVDKHAKEAKKRAKQTMKLKDTGELDAAD